ncbi:MAG: LEA type 2 family protein [Gemmatimonadetes bacterium]|nr:LEA type 2 family protein [Gemmatimonadota bacterium]
MSAAARGAARAVGPTLAAAALLLLVFLAVSCSLVYRRPAVRIVGVRVMELGLTGGRSRVRLEVTNRNRYGLEMRSLEYRIDVEEPGGGSGWREFASGTQSDTVRISARSTAEVEVDVPFRYQALGVALTTLLERGSARYRARGSVRVAGPFGALTVPFESSGAIAP